MGFESTNCMETKEFRCATWPSKELERKERNSYCPLNAPEKVTSDSGKSAGALKRAGEMTPIVNFFLV